MNEVDFLCDQNDCFLTPINEIACSQCNKLNCIYDRYVSHFFYKNMQNITISQTYCRDCDSLLHIHTEKTSKKQFIFTYRILFKSFQNFRQISTTHKRPRWKLITKINISENTQGECLIIDCQTCKQKIIRIQLTPYPIFNKSHKSITFKQHFEFHNYFITCPSL